MRKRVAVFGAGDAGLTAAHELARRGWDVVVHETNTEAGGFFRSARSAQAGDMPPEFSWHGLGSWYHNVYDVPPDRLRARTEPRARRVRRLRGST